MELLKLTALELGRKIQAGEVSVKEAVRAVIEQIREAEPLIHSYVTVDEEGAFAQAEEIQKKIDAGELTGPLAGVPVAVKDNMCIKGQLTTCSSRILSNFKPTYTAEAVENLKKAGAVIIGMLLRSGIGYRRFHPSAQFFLRSGRNEADLWNGIPLRACGIRFFP